MTPKANVNSQTSAADVSTVISGPCAKAVLRGTHLTFYYDDKNHETEGKVYEVSSNGYGVKGSPWAASGFLTASFDESCRDWNPTSMVFFFSDEEPARKSRKRLIKAYPDAEYRDIHGYAHCGFQTAEPEQYAKILKQAIKNRENIA